jgi:hypothetical protein
MLSYELFGLIVTLFKSISNTDMHEVVISNIHLIILENVSCQLL